MVLLSSFLSFAHIFGRIFSSFQPQHFIPISFYRIICFFLLLSFLSFSGYLFFTLHCTRCAVWFVCCLTKPHPRKFIVSARSGIRKYVVWCLICGGLSCLLGIMFLGVYFLVRSYTSTIGYFETVPTFVPATLVSNFAKIPILCSTIYEIILKRECMRMIMACARGNASWMKKKVCRESKHARTPGVLLVHALLCWIFLDWPFAHTQTMWTVISRVNSYGTSNLSASQANIQPNCCFIFMVISAFVLWSSHCKRVVWKCHQQHKIIIVNFY